jgi:hypothetical protein
MKRCCLPCLAGLTLSFTAPSEAQTIPPALQGYSIRAEYVELVESRRAGQVRQVWSDQVYISTKGRIFHRHDRRSTRPEGSRSFEAVGDEASGEGREARYRWVGNGLSREWTNRRGIRLQQWIRLMPASGGFTCRMGVDRYPSRGRVSVLSESCTVVPGNILAGR